jgi:hypothetical protein
MLVHTVQYGHTIFDTFMIWLPIWLPALLVGLGIQWLVVRSASLSALRKHERETGGRTTGNVHTRN